MNEKPWRALTLLLVLASHALRAESIVGFSYGGLRAVRPELVDRVTGRYVGEAADETSERRIVSDLRALGLFSGVTLTWSRGEWNDETGMVGDISFEEKNTFVALPMAGFANGGFSAGAAAVETNLFGMGNRLAVAGRVGRDSWATSARYANPLAAGGSCLFSLAGNVASGTVRISDADGNTLARFESSDADFGAAARARLDEANAIRLAAGTESRDVCARDGEGQVPESIVAPRVALAFERAGSAWDGTFDSGSSASAEIGLYMADSATAWVSADLAIQSPTRHNARVAIAASGRALSRDVALLNPDARTVQSFMMPGTFSAPRVACASIEAEAASRPTRIGTFSAFASYEIASGAGGRGGAGLWQGPKAGLRLYFRKIPLPGAAITAGYELGGTGFRFAFSLGAKL